MENKLIHNSLSRLEGLRGMAAIYVLIHHARLLLTQPYTEGYLKHPEQYSSFDKIFVYGSAVFKFGHEAVILFFVLSGFVIHLKQAKQISTASNSFNLADYLQKRALRIYPTLLFSLLLTYLLDLLWGEISKTYALENYTFGSFISNLVLIPQSAAWGNNYPIWSLKHEWFFYLIYPLLLFLTQKKVIYSFATCVVMLIWYIFKQDIPLVGMAAYTLTIWWMGVFTAETFYGRYKLTLKHLVFLVPGSTILLFTKLNQNLVGHDIIVGLLMTGVLAYILFSNSQIVQYICDKFLFFGTFSYSIYLLHFPLMEFLKRLILLYSAKHALPFHFGFVIAGSVLSLLIIYVLYTATEKPSQRLKAAIFKTEIN